MAWKKTPVAAVGDRPPSDEAQPRRSQTAATAGKPSARLDILRETQRFFVEEHAIIVPLTVREILEEQIGIELV